MFHYLIIHFALFNQLTVIKNTLCVEFFMTQKYLSMAASKASGRVFRKEFTQLLRWNYHKTVRANGPKSFWGQQR
jgi:hypothetical protein